MNTNLANLIFFAGIGQLSILIASALVPFRLKWKDEFQSLPPLHRQMYWVYGGYVVLSIVALGVISIINAQELANGSLLARSVCAYAAVFWGIRFGLQAVLDAKAFLSTWWLKVGYHGLTVLFALLTATFVWAAFH